MITINYGELAIGFFYGLVDARIDACAARTLKISIFEYDDGSVFISFDVIADIAVMLVGFND